MSLLVYDRRFFTASEGVRVEERKVSCFGRSLRMESGFLLPKMDLRLILGLSTIFSLMSRDGRDLKDFSIMLIPWRLDS